MQEHSLTIFVVAYFLVGVHYTYKMSAYWSMFMKRFFFLLTLVPFIGTSLEGMFNPPPIQVNPIQQAPINPVPNIAPQPQPQVAPVVPPTNNVNPTMQSIRNGSRYGLLKPKLW